MEDPRTQKVMGMAVALLTSSNPNYANPTIADVTAEILGSADGIDHVFGICKCEPDDAGEMPH